MEGLKNTTFPLVSSFFSSKNSRESNLKQRFIYTKLNKLYKRWSY